jgi:hypothetical protein
MRLGPEFGATVYVTVLEPVRIPGDAIVTQVWSMDGSTSQAQPAVVSDRDRASATTRGEAGTRRRERRVGLTARETVLLDCESLPTNCERTRAARARRIRRENEAHLPLRASIHILREVDRDPRHIARRRPCAPDGARDVDAAAARVRADAAVTCRRQCHGTRGCRCRGGCRRRSGCWARCRRRSGRRDRRRRRCRGRSRRGGA